MDNKKLTNIQQRLSKIKQLTGSSNLEASNPIKHLNSNADTVDFFKSSNDDDNDTRSVLGKKELNFKKVITQMDAQLAYIKSGAYGHTFKGIVMDDDGKEKMSFAVKIVAYTKKDDYGDEFNLQRPENAELCMLKVLSYFVLKNITPHIILPINTFDTNIKTFINLQKKNIVDEDNENYSTFVKNYENGKYYDIVNVIISEWANEGDLSMFLKKCYKKLKLIHWKCIFFQIISTLAIIQSKFPSFRHNDLKANNVLISKIDNNKTVQYSVNGNKYHVPSIGYIIYLWDFDFACIPGVVQNLKVYQPFFNKLNITSRENKYYDMHYFFCTLICKGFLPDLMNTDEVPREVKDFIDYVVPMDYRPTGNTEFVNKKCRLQIDKELYTPSDILNHEFFKEFHYTKK